MIQTHRRKRNSAFTFLEVLIAGALLTIGLVAIVFAIQSSYSLVGASQDVNLAINAMQRTIESLKSDTGWGNLWSRYEKYDGTADNAFFYIRPDGTLSGEVGDGVEEPNSTGMLGRGYFYFVTDEEDYYGALPGENGTPSDAISYGWGTGTVFGYDPVTNPNPVNGIDLNGDGSLDTNNGGIYVEGRTVGTPNSDTDNVIILPVIIYIEIFRQDGNLDPTGSFGTSLTNNNTGNYILERRFLLTSNFEE